MLCSIEASYFLQQNRYLYSMWDRSVRFIYVTSLRAKKTIRKPKTWPSLELRQRSTKYSRWDIMLIVWTVCASVPATSILLIPLSVTSNGPRTLRFAPTIVLLIGDLMLYIQ